METIRVGDLTLHVDHRWDYVIAITDVGVSLIGNKNVILLHALVEGKDMMLYGEDADKVLKAYHTTYKEIVNVLKEKFLSQ